MYRRKVHGTTLRLLREQADLPRRDLATALGCSLGYIKNIELGIDQPGGELVFRWLRLLSSHHDREITLNEISTPADTEAAA
jgi:transcriptional regulator with XRE-family HTH domain